MTTFFYIAGVAWLIALGVIFVLRTILATLGSLADDMPNLPHGQSQVQQGSAEPDFKACAGRS